jgi:hypothetical protein
MTNHRLDPLSIVRAMPIICVIAAFGCESSRTGLSVHRDAAFLVGDDGNVEPTVPTGPGGAISWGGATGEGSAGVTGGWTSPGGASGAGTTAVNVNMGGNAGGNSGSGGTTMAAPPTVSDSGYVTVSAGTVVMVGFISSATAGSGSSIALTYGTSNFCASGTVAANSTYKSWANAGFTVNQAPSGASGSSSPLAVAGSTISIGYVNRGGSELEFQLYDGSDYWCYILPPSTTPTTTTIPFASLNTQCWNGLGSPFTSGTPITSVSLVVPGSNISTTPYDFCFLGLTVN